MISLRSMKACWMNKKIIPIWTYSIFSSSLDHAGIVKLQMLIIRAYDFLKNLPPFFPKPVSSRLDTRRDLVSGLHLNSLRTENKVESAAETSQSFMCLQDSTLRCWSSLQVRSKASSPCVVSKEHPSKDSNFTLL